MINQTDPVAPATEEDLWRVYCDEWTVAAVFEVQQRALDEVYAEAWRHFEATYQGRVHGGDVQVTHTSHPAPYQQVHLKLRRPVMKGEFKHHTTALHWVREDTVRAATGRIVRRNSPEDHQLRNYTVLMLPE